MVCESVKINAKTQSCGGGVCEVVVCEVMVCACVVGGVQG